MADKITILGSVPSVNLGVKSWSSDVGINELESWATFDDPAFTVQAGRIIAVAPRRGAGLLKSADSTGPVREVRGGLPVAKFASGVLNYLHVPLLINGNSFSMAAIVHIDSYTASTRDLMALFETGNSVRVWRSAGRYDVRFGSTVLLAGEQVFNQTGWHLIIWSQHNGEVALRVQRLGGTASTLRAANTVSAGAACTPIIGADEIANGQIGATPSAGRAWQDCVAEYLVWRGTDILSADRATERAALVAYFNEVYGAAA